MYIVHRTIEVQNFTNVHYATEPPSVENDVNVWRYAILKLHHARNDNNNAQCLQN